MNAVLLLDRFGIGDYRVILVDFKLNDLAGYRVNICTPNARRLIEHEPSVVARYNNKAKELIVSYKTNRKLETLKDE